MNHLPSRLQDIYSNYDNGRPELLRRIILFGIPIAIIAVSINCFVHKEESNPEIGGSVILFLILVYFLNQRGKTRAAALLFVVGMWALFVSLGMVSTGIFEPLFSGQIVVILITGILIGRRMAMGMAIFSILSAFLLALVTELGWNHDILQMEASALAIAVGAIFLVSAVVLHILLKSTRDNLEARTAAIQKLSTEVRMRKQMASQLHHEAFHDALTNLPNRALFFDRLERAILRSHRNSSWHFAVMFLDLDRFKLVNDSLGHRGGDELLIKAADRICQCVRQVDTVARMGGDEFAVLLEDIAGIGEADQVADRIHASMSEPFQINQQVLQVSTSIGITGTRPDHHDSEDYLRGADLAMYDAKNRGGCATSLFSTSLREETELRAGLESDLRSAIESDELSLHYQPIMDIRSNQWVACEALLRWTHPRLGSIEPARIIPLAEESGLIVPIGEWVLARACQQAKEWNEQFHHHAPLRMCVNVSSQQLTSPDFTRHVMDTLQLNGLHPSQLCLDVTESVFLADSAGAGEILRQLKEYGVSIYLDDFGTGYSVLNQIRHYPLDLLKIDRVVIDALDKSSEEVGLLRTIMTLAREYDLQVIAEGVETQQQLDLLDELNCNWVQGFFFSKPLGPAALGKMLRQDLAKIRARQAVHAD